MMPFGMHLPALNVHMRAKEQDRFKLILQIASKLTI